MFIASPPASPPRRRDLSLIRAGRRSFTGSARFLRDPGNRARTAAYLTDMARAYQRDIRADRFARTSPELGHSYGEMAQAVIGSVVSADEPVDLLILAFSLHDLRPGRQTAAYLSHVTPGAPTAFAVCDQGSAAAFSGLRIAREYASSAGIRRALLIVVEQAGMPYDCPVPVPTRHQAVAMLYGSDDGGSDGGGSDGATPWARVAAVRQHPGVAPDEVADLAAADLTELTAGRDDKEPDGIGLVLSDTLAALWTAPAAGQVRTMPPGQPSTGVWWGLIDEFTSEAGHPDLLVAADYDPDLRYLCLTAFE